MDPVAILQAVSDLFIRVPWAHLYATLHRVFFLLDIALTAGVILLFIRAWVTREKIDTKAAPPSVAQILSKPGLQATYAEQWRKILEQSAANPPESFRMAIVSADALVDEMLKEAGFAGAGMAERLGRLNGLGVRHLNGVFRAHRIRNELAHASEFTLSPKDAMRVLGLYERFLKEVKVL